MGPVGLARGDPRGEEQSGADDDRAKIEAIAEAYKVRFEQQSVGLIISPACVRF